MWVGLCQSRTPDLGNELYFKPSTVGGDGKITPYPIPLLEQLQQSIKVEIKGMELLTEQTVHFFVPFEC